MTIFFCATCAKPLTAGDIVVCVEVSEQLIHAEGEAEPVSVLASKLYCQSCGWRQAKVFFGMAKEEEHQERKQPDVAENERPDCGAPHHAGPRGQQIAPEF